MSEIIRAKSKIKNADLEILKEAFRIVAENHQGNIISSTSGFLVYPMVDIGIVTREVPIGIWARVKKGQIEYLFDNMQRVQPLIKEIEQTYISAVYIKSLQNLGYQPQVSEDKNGIIIDGTKAGTEKISAIILKETGEVITDFDGFINRQCEREAERLETLLKEKGVESDVLAIEAKPDFSSERVPEKIAGTA